MVDCYNKIGDELMKNINYQLVGQRVKQLRNKKHLTQEQLAEACNISTSYLGHIERGSKKLSLETAVKIAQCLHVSLDALVIDGVLENSGLLSNIEAIIKKQDKKKQDQFNRLLKILAKNIDAL